MNIDHRGLQQTTLREVSDAKAFHVCRGDHIRTIHDMANCLTHLSDEEFEYHVNEEQHDLAVWVHEVLQNPLLAHDLQLPENVQNKEHCVKTIRDHVGWLESI
ncbi:MAG: hypothetical protein OXR66_02130 [Candidatus Woesearchaeota archaeon]|nr:hypothetical protein [Candidatus Woesearchaeota archaeon]